jgi:hypothetical protein
MRIEEILKDEHIPTFGQEKLIKGIIENCPLSAFKELKKYVDNMRVDNNIKCELYIRTYKVGNEGE